MQFEFARNLWRNFYIINRPAIAIILGRPSQTLTAHAGHRASAVDEAGIASGEERPPMR